MRISDWSSDVCSSDLRGECLADEAAQRLRDLVDGREVALVPDRTDRDRFGRLLRHVEVDGTDVGGLLVQEGLALARRYPPDVRSEEHTSELQSLMRISYAVFCLKKKTTKS